MICKQSTVVMASDNGSPKGKTAGNFRLQMSVFLQGGMEEMGVSWISLLPKYLGLGFISKKPVGY